VEAYVFFAVLFGAACHAGWNAFLKIRLEPFSAIALIAIMSAIVVLPVVPFLGVPVREAWPWIAASVAFHLGYFIALTEAYRIGDMGQVYPIARGSAPLMTALVSTLAVGEAIGVRGWLGVLILTAGVFLLSLRGGRGVHFERRTVLFALTTAVTICGYSVVDGIGARTAQNAHVYTVWLFLLDGLMMLVFVLARRGKPVLAEYAGFWKIGLLGGALSLAAYWIAIWAMTVAPIALVAALRETSVLFGAAIAVTVLKEPLHRARIVAALMIVGGLVLIRLQ
jgi:drug/metabolite transporter (DMT)-like permease